MTPCPTHKKSPCRPELWTAQDTFSEVIVLQCVWCGERKRYQLIEDAGEEYAKKSNLSLCFSCGQWDSPEEHICIRAAKAVATSDD